jgi:hypothetical protein
MIVVSVSGDDQAKLSIQVGNSDVGVNRESNTAQPRGTCCGGWRKERGGVREAKMHKCMNS